MKLYLESAQLCQWRYCTGLYISLKRYLGHTEDLSEFTQYQRNHRHISYTHTHKIIIKINKYIFGQALKLKVKPESC